MEIANHNKQGGGGGGFMKNKLVMSFYRAAKLAPSVQYATKFEPAETSSAVRNVSLSKPGGGFPTSDGYIHGPKGVGGDEQVDTKATSYIDNVKERRKLEELKIMNEELMYG